MRSCQLQLAPAIENQRKKMKEKQAAAGGEGTETNHYTERGKSETMDSAGGKRTSFAFLSWELAAKICKPIWTKSTVWLYALEKMCGIWIGQQNVIHSLLINWFLFVFCLYFKSTENTMQYRETKQWPEVVGPYLQVQ